MYISLFILVWLIFSVLSLILKWDIGLIMAVLIPGFIVVILQNQRMIENSNHLQKKLTKNEATEP